MGLNPDCSQLFRNDMVNADNVKRGSSFDTCGSVPYINFTSSAAKTIALPTVKTLKKETSEEASSARCGANGSSGVRLSVEQRSPGSSHPFGGASCRRDWQDDLRGEITMQPMTWGEMV